jgi:hypothetical protein
MYGLRCSEILSTRRSSDLTIGNSVASHPDFSAPATKEFSFIRPAALNKWALEHALNRSKPTPDTSSYLDFNRQFAASLRDPLTQ